MTAVAIAISLCTRPFGVEVAIMRLPAGRPCAAHAPSARRRGNGSSNPELIQERTPDRVVLVVADAAGKQVGLVRRDGGQPGEVVVVPSNPLSTDAHGKVARVLPDGAILRRSCGRVAAGGTRLAMAFGTLSAHRLESASHRSPDPAVLFYATDDDLAARKSSG
jgi:predicted dinucleotide-binding enzyme